GRQRIAPARNIASHRFQRAHHLAHSYARLNFAPPLLSRARLPLRIATDIACSMLDRVLQLGIGLLPSLVQIVLGNTERVALSQSVPTRGIAAHGAIAVTADVIHNAADRRFDLG